MKQKILFRVTMTDDKTRAKAMTKAVQFKGVSAVEIKGDHRNQIEVTGTEVDMICLTKMLRKKVAFAELVSVSKVEPPKKPEEEKKPAPCKPCPPPPCKPCPPPPCNPCPPPPCKPCPPPPCNPCPPPPCYPSPQGYGVPSAFPYPCNPYSYIGEPVYNHEPSCTIL
ncbi:PREDICTED: small proline-rich protein 2H isoform X2 [Brassica oleracea var. oleracea]|uniref:small proline-rich protein 2H isoform X2 n=1 Tax=Brassica oleracea var. oleracea TaxID=109376 RepID=UPI0006A72B34|nr:PREDICTED: small proline-rich protein 2H isoform X2 [Brassica oleracea var. oleracea]